MAQAMGSPQGRQIHLQSVRNRLEARHRDLIVIRKSVAPVEHHDLVARLVFPDLGPHLDDGPAALVADPERQGDLLGDISAVHRLVRTADAREVPLHQDLFRPHGQLPLGEQYLTGCRQLRRSCVHVAHSSPPQLLPWRHGTARQCLGRRDLARASRRSVAAWLDDTHRRPDALSKVFETERDKGRHQLRLPHQALNVQTARAARW
jgi:hypothetical protein